MIPGKYKVYLLEQIIKLLVTNNTVTKLIPNGAIFFHPSKVNKNNSQKMNVAIGFNTIFMDGSNKITHVMEGIMTLRKL